MNELTPAIAAFGSSIRWSQLPEPVRAGAVSAVASVCSMAKRSDHGVVAAIAALTSPGGTGQVVFVLNGHETLSLRALQIAAAAFSELADEASPREELSCVVVPAAVVATDLVNGSGEQLLTAVAAGLEIALRFVAALGDAHRDRGWDIVGSAGRLGAAVAASRATGLDAAELHGALGFASTTVSGLSCAGRDLRAFGAGKASADGLEAAVLAREGLGGPAAPLEGRRGLFSLVSRDPHPALLVDGLGSSWLFVDKMAPSELDEAALDLIVAADTSAFAAFCDRVVGSAT